MRESSVGNSFAIHSYGIKNMQAVEDSRYKIAKALGCDSCDNVIFTSGATESNNWVLKSLCFNNIMKHNKRKHIVVSAIEHSSIMSTCSFLEQLGYNITYVQPVDGVIHFEDIKAAIKEEETFLVCVMIVNNETGMANDVLLMSEYTHELGIYFMSDFTQYMTWGGDSIRIYENFPHIDFFTFSLHKVYGPLGVGCTVVRDSALSSLKPLIHGGGQEFGLRGGTSNVAGIVGAGKAIELLAKHDCSYHYFSLFLTLMKNLPKEVELNFPSLSNIVSLNFTKFIKEIPNYDGGVPMAELLSAHNIACSAGSACNTQDPSATDLALSHVLLACGFEKEDILNTVRISFTKYTKNRDIIDFCKRLKDIKKRGV